MNLVRPSARLPKTILGGLTLSMLLACFAPAGFGQTASYLNFGIDSPYRVGYYGNANMAGFPDGQLDIVNPGSTGGYSATDDKTPIGDLCANIYVFKADQEMVECCSCFISPNGQLQLSLDVDLTSNPVQNSATVALPVAGVIKIFTSSTLPISDGCTTPLASGGAVTTLDVAAQSYEPYGYLNSWNTHARQTVGGTSPLYTISEVPLDPATWAYDELTKVQEQCYLIQNSGSGHGRCTCGSSPI
jgi:hypothetical protein